MRSESEGISYSCVLSPQLSPWHMDQERREKAEAEPSPQGWAQGLPLTDRVTVSESVTPWENKGL